MVMMSEDDSSAFNGTAWLESMGLPSTTALCIVGTDGDDTIEGAAGDDLIYGRGGGDTIEGNDGEVGGNGDDDDDDDDDDGGGDARSEISLLWAFLPRLGWQAGHHLCRAGTRRRPGRSRARYDQWAARKG